MVDFVSGYTGEGPAIPLGYFRMAAEVSVRDGRTFVSFSNVMPDSQEMLMAEDEPATVGADGILWFRFVDGWGNSGAGAFGPDGRLSLAMVKRSDDWLGANIGRNYGVFRLTADACAELDALP